ncbi:MAG TPA: hypothetical protein VML54_16240 [Candidatus Limnocylindrales bacterium]|nr:hypothetical protein [Candidatus Limnocylindrales bacterium]
MTLAVPLALLALWEIASRLAILSPRYFPPPTVVAAVMADRLVAGELAGEVLVTLTRLGLAFVLAAGPGVGLGLLMGMLRPVRDAFEPYVAFLFPVPKIALLPFLLIMLGVGEAAFVLTGAISAFFQIVISTMAGVQTMDPRFLERRCGARRSSASPTSRGGRWRSTRAAPPSSGCWIRCCGATGSRSRTCR